MGPSKGLARDRCGAPSSESFEEHVDDPTCGGYMVDADAGIGSSVQHRFAAHPSFALCVTPPQGGELCPMRLLIAATQVADPLGVKAMGGPCTS